MTRKKSFALISAIILIVFTSIAVLGLSFFIIGNLEKLSTQEALLKSLYLSESGVQRALYFFRQNNAFSLGAHTVKPNELFYLSGTEAGLLIVDTRNTAIKIDLKDYTVSGLYLRSAADSQKLVITAIDVTWRLRRGALRTVHIGGKRVFRGKEFPPTAYVDIDDTVIDSSLPPKEIILKFIKYIRDPLAQVILINFYMQDGSSKELTVYPKSEQANFTFQSTGSVERISPPLRTITELEYNSAVSQIIGYRRMQ